MNLRLLSFAAALLTFSILAQGAEFSVAGLFSDGMVLQQKTAVPVWGTAEPGSAVTIRFGEQVKTGKTDEAGKWTVLLDPLQASKVPRNLEIKTASAGARTIKDVLVGEVWLCSGQSNMAMRLNHADGGWEEIASANDPLLRAFIVPKRPAERELDTVQSEWLPFNPANAGDFPAMVYYFAKDLRKTLDVPVGLVVSAWPGSNVATWLSRQALENSALGPFMPAAVTGWAPHHQPSNCFNGMIHPLAPFPLAGVIWYQGETDGMMPSQNPYLYRDLFAGLILDWRQAWHQPGLPFYWVQLPNLRGGKDWPILRESQAKVLELPHTGMITTVDIGTSTLLHPKNKDAFGVRMAALVLNRQYGKEGAESPTFASLTMDGDTVRLVLRNAQGLKTTDGQGPKAFEIAEAEGDFKPVEARIDGETIVIPAKGDKVAVRYAWQADPKVNLVNEAGLPVTPFRTDQRPLKGQEFVSEKLPEKGELAMTTRGADLLKADNPNWTLTTDEADTMKMVKTLASGACNIIFKDDETRPGAKFSSPTLFWTNKGDELADTANGATAKIDLELIQASDAQRGFDLEFCLKQADGKLRKYLLTIFPMQVRALQGGEVRFIGLDLDNTSGYHEYRIAVRKDGMAQVYYDNRLLAVFAGEIAESKSPYVRFGKTISEGNMIAHLASVGLDTNGAYAPGPRDGGKRQKGEEEDL